MLMVWRPRRQGDGDGGESGDDYAGDADGDGYGPCDYGADHNEGNGDRYGDGGDDDG